MDWINLLVQLGKKKQRQMNIKKKETKESGRRRKKILNVEWLWIFASQNDNQLNLWIYGLFFNHNDHKIDYDFSGFSLICLPLEPKWVNIFTWSDINKSALNVKQ